MDIDSMSKRDESSSSVEASEKPSSVSAHVIQKQSVKYDKMKSAYMSEFVSYNVLDSDYLLNKVVENKSIKVDELDDLIIPKKI
jgi:hypothetical protein